LAGSRFRDDSVMPPPNVALQLPGAGSVAVERLDGLAHIQGIVLVVIRPPTAELSR